jgi:hypothetical protein
MIHLDRWVLEGARHPKDKWIHDGFTLSPYKRTRVHNQGRKIFEDKERKKSSAVLR